MAGDLIGGSRDAHLAEILAEILGVGHRGVVCLVADFRVVGPRVVGCRVIARGVGLIGDSVGRGAVGDQCCRAAGGVLV